MPRVSASNHSATDPQLQEAVARAVGAPIEDVLDMRREPIEYDAFLAGRYLTRVRGTAVAAGERIEWSFVEKVTEGPAVASQYLYDNGARECEAYGSGLLDRLAPGIAAPRLYRAMRGHDGQLCLWLEDVDRNRRPPLLEVDILRAATHLGRLAGRWMSRVPDEPWLFRGWIDRHSQPEAIDAGLAILEHATKRDEIEARLGRTLNEAARLVGMQASVAAALDALPSTLCHHDAVAANVFPRIRGGNPEAVLIDWESIGPGPVGADLASLLFSSARRGDLPSDAVPALLPRALTAYADGLGDAGAQVPAEALSLGVHGAIALRWTLVRDVVRIFEGSGVAMRGSAPHESPEEALDHLIALVPVLLDSAAEARRLLQAPAGSGLDDRGG